jgi:hypothetical protein
MVSDIIAMQKHLRHIEREFAELRRLMDVFSRQHIAALREELMSEGFDEILVELVGSVPGSGEDYKDDIRRAISREYL